MVSLSIKRGLSMDLSFLNSDNITLIFSGVVAVSTVIYALLTWSLVSETKRMRKAQTNPFVSVISEPSEQWINLTDLVIRNIGLGPAYDIKFRITPDFEYVCGKFLSNVRVMKDGIPYLAPGQEIRFQLTELIVDYDKKIKSPFCIYTIYKNYNKENFEEPFNIDLSVWDQLIVGPSDIHRIADSVVKIANNMKK